MNGLTKACTRPTQKTRRRVMPWSLAGRRVISAKVTQRPLSAIIKEMAGTVLVQPEAEPSSLKRLTRRCFSRMSRGIERWGLESLASTIVRCSNS